MTMTLELQNALKRFVRSTTVAMLAGSGPSWGQKKAELVASAKHALNTLNHEPITERADSAPAPEPPDPNFD